MSLDLTKDHSEIKAEILQLVPVELCHKSNKFKWKFSIDARDFVVDRCMPRAILSRYIAYEEYNLDKIDEIEKTLSEIFTDAGYFVDVGTRILCRGDFELLVDFYDSKDAYQRMIEFNEQINREYPETPAQARERKAIVARIIADKEASIAKEKAARR